MYIYIYDYTHLVTHSKHSKHLGSNMLEFDLFTTFSELSFSIGAELKKRKIKCVVLVVRFLVLLLEVAKGSFKKKNGICLWSPWGGSFN